MSALSVATPDIAVASSPTSWEDLAACESSGNWHTNTGNGYYGGLQISPPTWRAYGGIKFAARADLATRTQQVAIAKRILRGQGHQAWPVCSHQVEWKATPRKHRHAQHKKTAHVPNPSLRTYRVRLGQNLSSIAALHHIRGGWRDLYARNRDTVGGNPSIIQPGQVLRLR
ncbi:MULTISPECIES: transglycosylase family protein [Streptomyces]|uniref:Transglycosylase n=1 Tax=Streptomyces kasugaensis TaxID=1946 RepID=A0A4Q9I073_STRKA|nr:transglycosylase family protein [Streptomyces kasugaensis]TBO60745.1 transglycosylase [Streptomyces kasugaensis]